MNKKVNIRKFEVPEIFLLIFKLLKKNYIPFGFNDNELMVQEISDTNLDEEIDFSFKTYEKEREINVYFFRTYYKLDKNIIPNFYSCLDITFNFENLYKFSINFHIDHVDNTLDIKFNDGKSKKIKKYFLSDFNTAEKRIKKYYNFLKFLDDNFDGFKEIKKIIERIDKKDLPAKCFYQIKNYIQEIIDFNKNANSNEYKQILEDFISLTKELPETEDSNSASIKRKISNDIFSIECEENIHSNNPFIKCTILLMKNFYHTIFKVDLDEIMQKPNNFFRYDLDGFFKIFLPIFKACGGKQKMMENILKIRLRNE